MQRSKKYTISWRDALHGFITAFLSASLTGVIDSLSVGALPDLAHIKTHALIGLSAGVGYLLKKFITNSDGKFTPEQKKSLL